MSFSFDETLADDLDKVRFNIGDTNEDEVLIADETIEAILDLYSDVDAATIACIDHLIAKESRAVKDRTVVGISTSLGQRINELKDIKSIFETKKSRSATLFIGGTSQAYIDLIESNEDIPKPAVSKTNAFENYDDS